MTQSIQQTNQCTGRNVRAGHTCLEGKRMAVVIATAEDASLVLTKWQAWTLLDAPAYTKQLETCMVFFSNVKMPNHAERTLPMYGLFLKTLNSMSVQTGTTEVQPWATIVLRYISKLYMTGREEDYCKNMCHAAMETGQVNSSQKKKLKRFVWCRKWTAGWNFPHMCYVYCKG